MSVEAVVVSEIVSSAAVHTVSRPQCVRMWLRTLPRKQQTDVKRRIQEATEPGEFLAQHNMYAGDITAAMALGDCLIPEAVAAAASDICELHKLALFFKTTNEPR